MLTASQKTGIDKRQLIELVPAMVAVYELKTGEYAYVSQAVTKLLGYTPDEVTRGGVAFVSTLIHPDDAAQVTAKNAEALARVQKAKPGDAWKDPVVSFEYRMRHKDGHYVWLLTEGRVFDWAEGRVSHLLNISIDITERITAEQQARELADTLQRRAEEATQSAKLERHHLENLFMQAPAMIAILQGKDARVQLVNPQARKLFGDRKVQGIPLREAYPELKDWGIFELVEKVYKTGKPVYGNEWPAAIDHRNDGHLETRYFNFVFAPYYNTKGVTEGVLVHSTEVTGQVTARQKAEASEERLELAMKSSRMGTWEWNIATNELRWSSQLKKLFGLKAPDDISYDKYLSLVHPGDRKLLQATIENAMKKGKGYRVEHRVIWPDGSVHWLLGHGKAYFKNGQAVRMVGTSMNIDDRKTAEMRLYESEQRFRSMADSAPVMIWEAEPNGARTYFNKHWLAWTGRSLTQERFDGWSANIHQEDRPHVIEAYHTAIGQKRGFRLEYRLLNREGKYHWILETATPRLSSEGQLLGYVGSCTDIDEIKHKQELEERTKLLTQQRTRLVALNKAKDEFISLASHQLRTPASGVKQYVGMLLQGYAGELTADQERMLHTAYESNERQLDIINDLLRVARIDAGQIKLKRTKVDIVAMLRDIIREQTDQFENRQQEIRFVTTGRKVTVMVDVPRLRMALENIIDNASKYSLEGKPITIDLIASRQRVSIYIVDQGVGIAKKDLPKLFQKFSRIDNPLSTIVGGTGLGLYLVKRIVDLHGGSVSVTSRPHKGTTFVITLPRNTS